MTVNNGISTKLSIKGKNIQNLKVYNHTILHTTVELSVISSAAQTCVVGSSDMYLLSVLFKHKLNGLDFCW